MLEAVIIAGANGAGKTTFARQLLPALYPDVFFLNVDEIQEEETAFANPVGAGRELRRRLAELEERRQSFAIETTLSSRMYMKRIALWKAWGYRTALHFIELPSEDYAEGYKHLVDEWYHWFSDDGGLRLVDRCER